MLMDMSLVFSGTPLPTTMGAASACKKTGRLNHRLGDASINGMDQGGSHYRYTSG
jgi:hypothetical protein